MNLKGLTAILLLGTIFSGKVNSQNFQCPSTCEMDVVETIPDGMEDVPHIRTFDSWKKMIDGAKRTIEIASYYWTLQPYEYNHTTADLGQQIYNSLLDAGTKRGVKINIVKALDSDSFPNLDTKELEEANAAEVRDLNFTSLIGAGILHTKMMIVDRENIYLGSSNFDWRALTQVKEIGVAGWNCSCLGEDLGKTFDVYWKLAEEEDSIPDDGYPWTPEFSSPYSKNNQMDVTFGQIDYTTYVSSAPPQFCPENRTNDLDAIYDVMENAEEFIHIAVMDYFPLIMFDGPLTYWPDLDNKLKSMAIDRSIKVKLLMGYWKNTRTSAENFLRSLQSVNGSYPWVDLQVKMYVVPADEDQSKIPFSRVNHNKYVVTDKSAYFSTSNWSGDYFISSGGIGIVVTPKGNGADNDIRAQLAKVFERDWNSPHAKTVDEIYADTKSHATDLIPSLFTLIFTLFMFI